MESVGKKVKKDQSGLRSLLLKKTQAMNSDVSDVSNEAKRLFAALSTLEGDNLCNYYRYKTISKNFDAIKTDHLDRVRETSRESRIDKVLDHFIDKHVRDCKQTYFRKFDEMSRYLDGDLINRLNVLLGKAIENLTSDNHSEKTYAEKLFDLATSSTAYKFELTPSYIYEAVKDSAKNELGDKSLELIGKGKVVSSGLERNLKNIFHYWVIKPCRYFRKRFGPTVFESFLFDSEFDKQTESDRVDFYEALVKYRFCYSKGSDESDEFVSHFVE